jgi:hypothetical protein
MVAMSIRLRRGVSCCIHRAVGGWTMVIALASIGVSLRAEPFSVSGRYPHLATYNSKGECGTGAVVEWAGRLWVISYGQHFPMGSDDKLYEINNDLSRVTRPESIGGTPANRMVHRESNQLFIGPYAIDAERNVRAIPYERMFGRLTATARHLSDPANKVLCLDMEGLLYEVDVKSLAVNLLFRRAVPGWHAKGAYTAQGRFVMGNNGESPTNSVAQFRPFQYQFPFESGGDNAGVLAEWDGNSWRPVRRRQFTEVTGPGGILGSPSADAPLWAMGWDKRSLILMLLDRGVWHEFRLPKSDYSYDGTHGWHTEWPRIREVVPGTNGKPGKWLANMHGGWFDFPPGFCATDTSGLRPLGAYLKVTADFTHWNGRVVFGCDDAAKNQFFSGLGLRPDMDLVGQSNSNLWFTSWENLRRNSLPVGWGGWWRGDDVKQDQVSVPYLFHGYAKRVLHVSHRSARAVTFRLEVSDGDGAWRKLTDMSVPANGYAYRVFPESEPGQWIRAIPDVDAAQVTAYFHYGPSRGVQAAEAAFAALAANDRPASSNVGVLRPRGEDSKTLQVLAQTIDASGRAEPRGVYEIGEDLKLRAVESKTDATFLQERAAPRDAEYTIEGNSVLVVEEKQRFRLPIGFAAANESTSAGFARTVREVVTERALLNAAGTLYVLPRTNSGGVRAMKPIATHRHRIFDYCSWRGMLVLSGTIANATGDGHFIRSEDGKTGLWFGDVDDLWKLGKPTGTGGPWADSNVLPREPSDPYMMTGYDQKRLTLRHDSIEAVTISVEVDVTADGRWVEYKKFQVPPNQVFTHSFPDGYAAHWVRFTADRACKASAVLYYD